MEEMSGIGEMVVGALTVDDFSGLMIDSTCYVWDNVHLNKSGSLILAEHIYKAITGKKAPKLENAFAN